MGRCPAPRRGTCLQGHVLVAWPRTRPSRVVRITIGLRPPVSSDPGIAVPEGRRGCSQRTSCQSLKESDLEHICPTLSIAPQPPVKVMSSGQINQGAVMQAPGCSGAMVANRAQPSWSDPTAMASRRIARSHPQAAPPLFSSTESGKNLPCRSERGRSGIQCKLHWKILWSLPVAAVVTPLQHGKVETLVNVRVRTMAAPIAAALPSPQNKRRGQHKRPTSLRARLHHVGGYPIEGTSSNEHRPVFRWQQVGLDLWICVNYRVSVGPAAINAHKNHQTQSQCMESS